MGNYKLTHASLFSGIGGGELSAEWAGWENIFHCEINPFGQQVLKYYWPNSISYHDITKTDFSIHRGTIDVLTGGFPCQPYSAAGLRKGKEDERHLWPQMLRAIQEIQPRWVVGENVLGITNWSGGLVFEEVQTDLEASGYEVQAYVLPACGVNAPHKRDRVWFIAYSNSNANRNISKQDREANGLQKEHRPTICSGELNGTIGGNGVTSNSDLLRCEWGGNGRKLRTERQDGNERLKNMGIVSKQNWEIFPSESPVHCGNDGFSTELSGFTVSKHRQEAIKAYGNAIVPQVLFQIFKSINQHEQTKH